MEWLSMLVRTPAGHSWKTGCSKSAQKGALHRDALWGKSESLKPLRGRKRNSHWHPGKGSPPQENSHQSCSLPEENDIEWAPHFTLLLSPTSCQSGEPPESRRLREPLDRAQESSAIQIWMETDRNLHRQVENFQHPVLEESKQKEGLEHREPGSHSETWFCVWEGALRDSIWGIPGADHRELHTTW